MLKAIFKASDFLYVARFISHEETRYYLNGVLVDCANGRLVATDGHRLGLLKPEADEMLYRNETSVILSGHKALLTACKAERKTAKWLRLYNDRVEIIAIDERMKVTAEIMADYTGPVAMTLPASGCYIDGTFPDYERVIPDVAGPMDCLPFNANYMADFAGPEKNQAGVSVVSSGKGGPMLVANNDPRFIGVLMPFRGDHDPLTRCRALMGRNVVAFADAAD